MHQGMSQLVVERNFEVTRGTFGNLAAVPRITLYIVYNIYIYTGRSNNGIATTIISREYQGRENYTVGDPSPRRVASSNMILSTEARKEPPTSSASSYLSILVTSLLELSEDEGRMFPKRDTSRLIRDDAARTSR